MLLIPAIDLKDGVCVRLRQGIMEQSTTFSQEPSKMARQWLSQGARRLHVVDLNGAFAGEPKNKSSIQKIVEEVNGSVPIQLGGGIRDLETIRAYLETGITYVVLGTAAIRDPGFLRDACKEFPGHIIVGLDAKEGLVAVDGWATITTHRAQDLAKKYEQYGVSAIIYTDIGRDGMLQGVNIEATTALAESSEVPIIASGGISKMEDIRVLTEVESLGVAGAVIGRAIYEGAIDFSIAQDLADRLGRLG